MLDLFFTNNTSLINRTEVIPEISDHDVVFIDTNVQPTRTKPTPHKTYQYKKANFEALKRDLNDCVNNILEREPNMSTNELWLEIKESLLNKMDEHIPHKMTSTRFSLPWVTQHIRRMIRKKQRAYNKARNSHSHHDWKQFRDLRKAVQKEIRSSYWKYVTDIVCPTLETKPKTFWSFIKNLKRDQSGVSPLKENGTIHSDSKTKAEILNRQFESVFSNEDLSNIPSKGDSPHSSMPCITITTPGVTKILKNLKIHKASGPDEIPARILKETADIIAPAITALYNKSLNTGDIPSDWLKADIVALFKKGHRYLASNYRPVSLTSIACKAMEHILVSNIMQHLEEKGVLADAQHGFRRKRSTETQLLITSHDFIKALDQGKQIDAIIMDFAKAFDKVPHERLLHKCQYYGIRGNTLKWIRSFLTGRTQRVLLDGTSSESRPVRSGVPQGTVLGPILFLVFINDLPDYVDSKVRLFADDCVIYREINNPQDSSKLQEDLSNLGHWEKEWQMSFHPDKCEVLHVSKKKKAVQQDYILHGKTLGKTNNPKYLGVTMTNTMQWNTHINTTAKKANQTLGFIKRNLKCCPKKTKETAYKMLVRPKLEYCSSVWDPYQQTQTQKLEKVQRRAARFVQNNYSREASVTNMMTDLKWQPLQHRRTADRLIILYKITHYLVAIPSLPYLQPSHGRTRQHHPYMYTHYAPSTDIFKFSFFPRTIIQWNCLPASVVEAPTLESFKTTLQGVDISSLPYH